MDTGHEEEPCETEQVDFASFDELEKAKDLAWARLEEGFFVCMNREGP